MEKEEQKTKEEENLKKMKEKLESARKLVVEETQEGVPQGMTVQAIPEEDSDEDEDSVEALTKKIPERKTKKQRRKAEKLKEEVGTSCLVVAIITVVLIT